MTKEEIKTGELYGNIVSHMENGLDNIIANTRTDFQKKIHLKKNFFKNKTILDFACGSGRFSNVFADYGAKQVIGIDISEDSLKHAMESKRPNTEFYRMNIYNHTLKQKFDAVFAIGCLMHTKNPRLAFDILSKLVKTNGAMVVWVYEKQNIIKEINTKLLRCITTRLPYELLKWLSIFIATIYKAKLIRKMLNTIMGFSFRVCDNIDTLGVPYYYRFTEGEIRQWFNENGFRKIRTTYISKNKGIKKIIHGKYGGGFGMAGIKISKGFCK